MIQVWGRTNSINVQKVLWTLAELGLAFERRDVGGAYGGLDDEGFRRMNPHGRIPVLKDGETTLWESNAIVRYLAARYGVGGLWDADPAARALSDRWMDWQATLLSPHLTTLLFNMIRLPEPERNPQAAVAATVVLEPAFRLLDEAVTGRPFLAGDRLTIGDIPIGCALWRWMGLPIERPPLAGLEAYFMRLKERPGYREHVMLPLS